MMPVQLRQCGVCSCSTREGKPFCPSHVEENSYVKWIHARLAEMEAEVSCASVGHDGIPDIPPDGYLADEVVVILASYEGMATDKRINRRLMRGMPVVHGILNALARTGRVTLRKTRQGSIFAQLKEVAA